VNREQADQLLREYTKDSSLMKHALAVEAAMRHYARVRGEDEERWGVVGLLHDFDYERYPEPPDHTHRGAELFAVDELCGFIIAVALVRPNRLEGMEPKSVRKKMKDKRFAAAVSREDITKGAELLEMDLNEHIGHCITALQSIADQLGLAAEA
jgi:predicted hydrolase (HD superfamily)